MLVNNEIKKPKISVIMGIYNCSNTLSEAIDSILNQSFSDWELIMCDDGSTDNTFQIATTFQKQFPNKIILLKNNKNYGLNFTLNKCLKSASGEYIARMDGDDRCSEDRFEKEITTLEQELDISIVSSDMQLFDETGIWGLVRYPEYPSKDDFLHGSPFCHASSMVRKDALEAVNGYSVEKKYLRVEDYHLWVKMYEKGYKGKNIQLPLYQMRDNYEASNRRKFKFRLNEAYVRIMLVKQLKMAAWKYIFALRPIIIGLIPNFFYNKLHKRTQRND